MFRNPIAKARRLLTGISLAVPALLSTAAPVVAQDVVYPGETWEYVWRDASAVRAYGWDPPGLGRAWRFIRDSSNTTGLIVIDRGRVVLEFGDVEELSYVASVRKSILAMLYGEYVEDGTIDLDKTLADLGMDDVGGLLDIEKQAKIEHLITARSGVYHPASNSGDNLADAPERGSQQPGEYMLYWKRKSWTGCCSWRGRRSLCGSVHCCTRSRCVRTRACHSIGVRSCALGARVVMGRVSSMP